MIANAVSLLGIFETKLSLEVPLFQRQYVWNKNQQWEPLWEDISRKFTEYLEGRTDAPVHFLGAMVLDQKQTPTSYVVRRQVIDGQQRLTTIQIFLAAFRDVCKSEGCEDLATECETFTENKGMTDRAVEKFKVSPTKLDQAFFTDVISAGSLKELETRYPSTRKKYAKKDNPRPIIVEAYLYFYQELQAFLLESEKNPAIEEGLSIDLWLGRCFQALKNALKVVVIDLEPGDDAQVIFETLNSRGEPLLPADLLRNYIFLRASRQNELPEELYEKYWSEFDDEFWRDEINQGRMKRPRSDLFLQHLLASRQAQEIPIKHLFIEYKHWIEKSNPFSSVEDELRALTRQGADFKRLISADKEDLLFPLSKFLTRFEISTAYPLLLHLLDCKLMDQDLIKIASQLESYFVRRAVCDLTTKNYNRVFLQLTRYLKDKKPSAAITYDYLRSQTGESTEWPSDAAFSSAWRNDHVYHSLNNPKMVHILRRLNETYIGAKSESIAIDTKLTVEHILPQWWFKEWPLSNGETGLTNEEIYEEPENPLAIASSERNSLLHTFGNLTILTQPLNSSVSNSNWVTKKPEIMSNSLLPINQQLHKFESWSEIEIKERGDEMLTRALKLWSR